MPPARPRAIDESRSETSSTATNLKDRTLLNAATSAGVSKSKKTGLTTSTSAPKNIANGQIVPEAALPVPTVVADVDPGLPRLDWASLSPSTLLNYRTAYHIPTSTSYSHPHAQQIYGSSQTALRAPSAVLTRQKLHQLKQQRRKLDTKTNGSTKSTNGKSKTKEKDNVSADLNGTRRKSVVSQNKDKDDASSSTTAKSHDPSSIHQDDINSVTVPVSSTTAEYIGKQPPTLLATAVRKHFNAQQLNEAETVARFIYVARQGTTKGAVKVEGSDGDGKGWWMGSQGREVRRGEGGDIGFRLRFRP